MEKLFAGRSVQQHMVDQQVKVRTLVRHVGMGEFEQGGAAVVEALMARCALAVPKLVEDRVLPPKVEERGAYGAEVTISVPFTGDQTLFFVRPSEHAMRLDVDLQRSALVFSYSSTTRDAAAIRAEVDRLVSELRAALEQIQREMDASSVRLRVHVQEEVERRQAVLAAYASAAGLADGKTPT